MGDFGVNEFYRERLERNHEIFDRKEEEKFERMRDERHSYVEHEEEIDPDQIEVNFDNHLDNRSSKYRSSVSVNDWTFFGHSLSAWLKHWCLEVEYHGIRYGAANLGGSTQDFRDVTGVNEFDGLATWEQHQLMQKYIELRADKFVDAHGNKLSEVIA